MNRKPFFAFSLFLANALVAQQPPDLTEDLEAIINTDQIQAAGKKMQDLASTSADVTVLRSAQLKALGYRTLGDALGGVLGFRTNEDHAYQGLGVRGLYVLGDQNTRVLVLLDGHALNSPAEIGSSKVGEDFSFPIELIDRIEIVRGPASSLYGNNAFQALINVVSYCPDSGFQGAMALGTGGLYETWMQGAFPVGKLHFNVVAQGVRRDGFNRHYSQLGEVYPELATNPLPKSADQEKSQSAYLHVRGAEWNLALGTMSRTQRLASGPFGALPGDSANLYKNKRLSGDFRYEPRLGITQALVRLFGDRNEFYDAFMADPLRSNYQQYDLCPDWSLGFELQARSQLHERFSMTLGTEQRFHHYHAITDIVEDDVLYQTNTDINYRIGNTYLDMTWNLHPKWTLVGGMQLAQWTPTEADIRVENTPIDVLKDKIERLTPRASLVFEASKNDYIKLISGEGFRFPTLFERYYTDDEFFFVNDRLKPEVIQSHQLAWIRKWKSRIKSQLAGSLFRWKNFIGVGVPIGGTEEMQQYQNQSEVIKGKALEGDLDAQMGAFEVGASLGWYEWMRAGQKLANVSPWNGSLKVIYRQGPWSLAGEARYVGSRKLNGDEQMVATAGANWTLRTSLRFDQPGFWAQVSLEDLTESRRRDLVAVDYDPIRWMAGEGVQVRLVLGLRL